MSSSFASLARRAYSLVYSSAISTNLQRYLRSSTRSGCTVRTYIGFQNAITEALSLSTHHYTVSENDTESNISSKRCCSAPLPHTLKSSLILILTFKTHKSRLTIIEIDSVRALQWQCHVTHTLYKCTGHYQIRLVSVSNSLTLTRFFCCLFRIYPCVCHTALISNSHWFVPNNYTLRSLDLVAHLYSPHFQSRNRLEYTRIALIMALGNLESSSSSDPFCI